MQIIKGTHKGKTATLRQFANDWMTVDITDGDPGVIVNPRQVRLDPDEQKRMRNSLTDYEQGDRTCGRFWAEWQMNDDGTFTARPR
ncbi:hypothetical protein ABZY58_11090 [Micromonospora tulbaghiae]|uniref:hypothetical protein n=1 Tax=Micromonospora tulbaghiae TaxID=479978 RepID=UPI0033A5450C